MSSADFRRELHAKARRLRRGRSAAQRLWAGLGLVGAIGWVVVLPMLGGVFLGRKLDASLDTNLSFTLGLMLLGLACGAYSVWRFFLREIT